MTSNEVNNGSKEAEQKKHGGDFKRNIWTSAELTFVRRNYTQEELLKFAKSS